MLGIATRAAPIATHDRLEFTEGNAQIRCVRRREAAAKKKPSS